MQTRIKVCASKPQGAAISPAGFIPYVPPYVTVRRCCPFSSASRQMGPARRSSNATRCARGAARRCVARSRTVWRSRCRCRHLGQTRTSKRMARPRSLPQPQPRVVWNAPSRGRTRNSNASGCPHSRRCPASRPSRQTSSRRRASGCSTRCFVSATAP